MNNAIYFAFFIRIKQHLTIFAKKYDKSGKRSAELENALQWLIKAEMVYQQELVSNPYPPLAFNADTTYFKIFMADVGLLRKRCGLTPKAVLEASGLFPNFKGALTENYVMAELVKQGITPYFWRSSNSAEVDFIVQDDERIIPLEAKSEGNTKAKSYAVYCQRYKPELGIKISMNNVGDNIIDKTLTYSVPLYLLFRLPQYLK